MHGIIDHMSDRERTVLAFLIGALAGAAAGLLLAPRSGKETRERKGRTARGAKDDLDELIAEGRRKWSAAKGRTTEAASMSHDEVDDFVHFLMKEGRDLWARLKDETEEPEATDHGRPHGSTDQGA